ncbi:GlxA family transcriptional regulator [Sciscionella marina]|uniref:GlxA family transcriptional regulator n=1 Tax=Sciscionella marina TaxID=508770 RepID=UPI00036FCDDE|nr:GlxA family transcriptional regulator [Sciscionella marina]
MRSVLIPLFDGVQSLDVTGPLEVFTGARTAKGEPAYRVVTAGLDGAPVRTSAALRLLPDTDLRACETPEILLVPGGPGTKAPDPALLDWLRVTGSAADRVLSVCTGAFLLAEAGLLDGRRATTHWYYCAALADRYPDVRVDPEPIFVRDGPVATSAGVTSGIDLALAIVEEHHGRDTALRIARGLVMFLRRPGNQAQFSAQLDAQLAHRDPVRRAQQWILEHPEADLCVTALAERASLSPRQFTRAFTAEVGVPPGRFVDQVRLEAARRGLEDTGAGIGEVARDCGYGTPEAMRRAFIRALAVSPAEYRRRVC